MLCYVKLYSKSWRFISFNPPTTTFIFLKRNIRNRFGLVWTTAIANCSAQSNKAQLHGLLLWLLLLLLLNRRKRFVSRNGVNCFGFSMPTVRQVHFALQSFNACKIVLLLYDLIATDWQWRVFGTTFWLRQSFCWHWDSSVGWWSAA